MVEVGDRILVESEKVGSVTRSGVVTAVDDRLITVRWDSGSESVFVPSAGALRVTGHSRPLGRSTAPELAGRARRLPAGALAAWPRLGGDQLRVADGTGWWRVSCFLARVERRR